MIEDFIQNITKNNKVFVIEFKEDIAISQSLLFKDDANNPVNVVCHNYKSLSKGITQLKKQLM